MGTECWSPGGNGNCMLTAEINDWKTLGDSSENFADIITTLFFNLAFGVANRETWHILGQH